jgi:hypothetical protein
VRSSQVKIKKVNQTLVAGVTYDFLLDFDVENSVVVQAGNSGNFNLHPVVRVSTKANLYKRKELVQYWRFFKYWHRCGR